MGLKLIVNNKIVNIKFVRILSIWLWYGINLLGVFIMFFFYYIICFFFCVCVFVKLIWIEWMGSLSKVFMVCFVLSCIFFFSVGSWFCLNNE